MPEILMEEKVAWNPGITGMVDQDRADFRGISKNSSTTEPEDRPGWIPPEIAHDWDTNPYAYQTEEELMPAGGLHGELLTGFAEVVRAFLETKGLRFLADTFMLYRDKKGVKQRISPDFIIMPFRSPPPSAYDLDSEPPPLAVLEITSPKSHASDKNKKLRLYTDLGIPAYLLIDAITPGGKIRGNIQLMLWRKEKGEVWEVQTDDDGYLPIPEMRIKIKAERTALVVVDIETGEILHDSGQLRQKAERERQRAEQERQRAERLAEKLREMGISPDEI